MDLCMNFDILSGFEKRAHFEHFPKKIFFDRE